MRKWLILFVLLLSLSCFGANTWYVSPSGSDANACNGPGAGAACRSFNFVFTTKFVCGDTVFARGGIYYLPLTEGGSPITLPVCAGSNQGTIMGYQYGYGAVLTPSFNSSGGVSKVTVTNGAATFGSYTGTLVVGTNCPGMAGAGSLAPASTPCGSGFTGTATAAAGVITSVTVTSPGSGYPPSAVTWVVSGEQPFLTDLLQIWQNGNVNAPAGCVVGNAGVTGGCLLVTWNADDNDVNYPSCSTPIAHNWQAQLPTNFIYAESFFYQPGGTGPINRRTRPQTRGKNAIGVNGDSTMCKAAANQSAANIAFGCPGGGIAGLDCAVQGVTCNNPTDWYGGYIQFEYTAGTLDNLHSLGIGDIEIQNQEVWTWGYLRLTSATPGPPNVARLTGPASSINGQSAGFIPGREFLIKNRGGDLAQGAAGLPGGQIYLDRCHASWTGASSCSSGTPEANWFAQVCANTTFSEDPNVDVVYVPQMPGTTLIQGTNTSGFLIAGITVNGGNYYPPATGLASRNSQPAVPAMVKFSGLSNTTFQGVQLNHMGGEAFQITGKSISNKVKDSSFSDGWGALVKIGAQAQNGDVCSGGGQNIPSDFQLLNTLVNGPQRDDPTGESRGVYIGDVNGWLIDHSDLFRSVCGMLKAGDGLNMGAQNGQLAYCTANWTVSNSHLSGDMSSIGTTGVCADIGLVHSAANHPPGAPAGSLFSDPGTNDALYNGHFFNNVLHDHVCDPVLSLSAHCAVAFYGDQGTWGVHFKNNLVYRTATESFFLHNSSVPTVGYPAAQFLPEYAWVDQNIFATGGSNYAPISKTRIYHKGSVAAFGRITGNIEVYDSSITGQFRQSQQPFTAQWGAFDYSNLTILTAGSGATCAGAVSCGSPASVSVSGCSVAPTLSLTIDSGKLYAVSLDPVARGSNCVSPVLTFSNFGVNPTVTPCLSSGAFVPCTPVAISPFRNFSFGGAQANSVYDARGSTPQSGVCSTSDCLNGNTLESKFSWGSDNSEDVGSIACDPLFGKPGYPDDDYHPTNWGCLSRMGFTPDKMFDYTKAGRTMPIIQPTTLPQFFPALTGANGTVVPHSSYIPSYVTSPVTQWNVLTGAGFTTWKR